MKPSAAQLFLRPYEEGDLQAVVSLFYDTIHSVNLKDYSPEQSDAWAPKEPDLSRWRSLLTGEDTWVAVQDGRIVGFANRDGEYFDCLYVHKDYQRRGVAKALAERIEGRAAAEGHAKIRTDASLTARPFFEQRGYAVVRRQCVHRAGQVLVNFAMERSIQK
ncbi:GNAT family N-acetyltransferase [uncultured Megasphaera sp.]|uniref:GNAT family N-acetyltransferase n=1 Tax=uncultured Megasphaera sp. TaxID=165188 RepID=UPI002593D4CA|nr:GNAT family N-acetyltransferase [uncultured Megasphaera sp.]